MIGELKKSFNNLYGYSASYIVRAPGRINLIGEHTDYNGGLILPAAINKFMYFAFSENGTEKGNIYAKDLKETFTIDLKVLRKTDLVWVNYLVGLLREFQSKGVKLRGFDCVFTSDIPIGAGMSSSAALECGFVLGIDYLCDSNLDKWTMVDMSHHSNHTFMNIYGGIMDQFSSLFGKENQCILMNCHDRSFEYQDLKLQGYSIVVIDSKVKHEHTTSGYNDRAAECKKIENTLSNYDPTIKKISDASIEIIDNVGSDWSEHLRKRAHFVISENKRVRSFAEALRKGNFNQCGQLLYASHHGLQHDFEVSCDELDLLVNLTKDKDAILGSRMMGGGFGGCSINLIQTDKADDICEMISLEYYNSVGINAEIYHVEIAKGAEVIVG